MSVSAPERRHNLAYTNTVNMPVSRNAHHTQFPATPFLRTMSVTRLGVSEEKVVATIEMPSSHQGMLRPDRKNSVVPEPARRAANRPIVSVTANVPMIMAQSIVSSCMRGQRLPSASMPAAVAEARAVSAM